MKAELSHPARSLRRRELLAGLAGTLLLPVAARAASEASPLRPMLDRAAALPDPSARIESLRRETSVGLSPADVAIRAMVLRGLERERDLLAGFRLGKSDGSSPYVLSHRHGAFLDIGAKSEPATLARRLDEESGRLRADAAQGVIPPVFILDKLLAAERPLLANSPREIAEALARQIAAVEAVRSHAPTEPGIGRLAGGEIYYARRLACTTGSSISPAELNRFVLDETRRLLLRADRLLRGLGLAGGSVGARLQGLKQRPADRYADQDAARSRAVADMNAALARLRPHLALWFNPPLELGATVRRMTIAEEQTGKRGYRDLPTDGRPATYFPDLARPSDRPRWTLVTVAYHETLPGHALQFRRQALADPHPLQIRFAPGYGEGWAIYAESLVDRMGLLSPIEQVGFIQSVLFRLARVTADIGVHLHGWSRQRALTYLEETVGFELFFPFDVEVDRYCVQPAEFAGDALSALTLMRMARGRTGARLRAFHDAVLNSGPLGVEALEKMVA